MSQTVPCVHCGLPAPARDDGAPSFCCAGCRTVHGLLHDAGLGDYYDLRSSLEAPPSGHPAAPAGQELHARYAHLDDPELARVHGMAPGRATLELAGLHCAACVWVLERLPRLLPGVSSARVDYGRGRIHLQWDPEQVSLSTLAATLDRLGYPPRLRTEDADAERARRTRSELWRLAVTGALTGNVMLLTFALYGGASDADATMARFMELLSLLLAVPAVAWGALPFYRGAWSGLRAGVLHMDLPISLGIIAGFSASAVATLTGTGEPYYDSVTALVFLLLVGRFVQQRGQQRVATRGELWQGLVPGMAERRQGDEWVQVYATALRPGDRLRVRTGERMAADGHVREGRGHVDLSMLTGESRPEPVAPGRRVLAGSINTGPPLEIEVEAVGSATRLGQVVERLGSADAERAPVARMADRLAGWFVATVIGLSVVGGITWWLHAGPTRAFEVVVSLLVVSCPCALGLATPLALTVARGRAARAGFVVRSTAALEALASARRVVLDKTGTVTEGAVRVVDPGEPGHAEALRLAAVLERDARHPLADALRRWGREDGGDDRDPPTDVVEHPGRGVEGRVGEHRLRVGSPRWIEPPASHRSRLEELLARGLTPVVIEVDGEVAAVIGLGDRLRPEAAEVVRRLRAHGYSVGLRSGDHPRIVRAVADALGIDDARGGLAPEDKAAEISGDLSCVMVGDGINDALALRTAAVGVAVGGGAEAALAVADVYLQQPGLGPLWELLRGARRARAVVRRNLTFSLVYNLSFASLALAGLVTPLLAAILMPLSSLTVVLGSLLQRSYAASNGNVGVSAAQSLRTMSPAVASEMQ
ncbi:MAG: cadmium-translocating P-type ATPase [Myxococcales bacterium]|nr:cadmium-translocating P-type ATPase [Myxococcales bacterium]